MSELAVIFYRVVQDHSNCLICGSPHIQFHHVKPKEKLSLVYEAACKGGLPELMSEMNKTVPLCDGDHKAVHRGRIPGWLDGLYDNGGQSNDFAARKYMPYLGWFGRQHSKIMFRFYRDHVQREHDAIEPLIKSLGVNTPKYLKLVGNNGQKQTLG